MRPSSQPILPRGYGIPATVRDVFAIPTEFRPVFAALPAAAPERKNTADILSSGQAAEPPAIPLVLVGIISGGGQKVAIIKYAGGSRSYRINDFIGPYQLIAIESAATVLLGPKGRSTLLLELER
ncbi:hypothetical protein [Sporomusa aerivorans]|uniref:hypothetical protein n=1 Tax=Sporomusa aerivorans TaxID=204936 RepID=UPI00352B443C